MLGIVGLVLLAALYHATWNAFVKASDDWLAGLVSINPLGAVSGLIMIPIVPLDANRWTKGTNFDGDVHGNYPCAPYSGKHRGKKALLG